MKVFTCKNNLVKKDSIKTVAIGVFDGVHKGHSKLFKHLGTSSAVIIIDNNKKGVLTPFNKKCKLIKCPVFFYKLEDIKNLHADEFLKLLQKDFTNLNKIVVGYDFRFGKDRENSANDIEEFFNGEVKIVDEFILNKHSVHSTFIKSLLNEGKIQEANEYLGRTYSIEGLVVKGQGLGKKSLYPTINIENKDGFFLPKDGVYASLVFVNDNFYKAATFIGQRVSVDGSFAIESYLLDVENIEVPLDENVEIFFTEFIRENRKFDNLEALKKQIEDDILKIKEVLKFFTCKG